MDFSRKCSMFRRSIPLKSFHIFLNNLQHPKLFLLCDNVQLRSFTKIGQKIAKLTKIQQKQSNYYLMWWIFIFSAWINGYVGQKLAPKQGHWQDVFKMIFLDYMLCSFQFQFFFCLPTNKMSSSQEALEAFWLRCKDDFFNSQSWSSCICISKFQLLSKIQQNADENQML